MHDEEGKFLCVTWLITTTMNDEEAKFFNNAGGI